MSNPNAPKIANFVDLSVSFDMNTHLLHIFASDVNNVIHHTTKSADGKFTAFDSVPN